MDAIFYEEFDRLLEEYSNPTSREERIIKLRLDSIVNLYRECEGEEREFADEIILEFSRIVALVKNRYQKELLALTEQCEAMKAENGQAPAYMSTASRMPATPHMPVAESSFEYDREVLEAFYEYFKGDYPLAYWQIEGYKFESNEERKALVNLTIWDYVNRIKTFSKKYLHEIYPLDTIPNVIHGDGADEYESYEPIVFIYNNLEIILAKMKTTNESDETVKQRLNIRSALRKLNDFKQAKEA